MFFWDRPWFWLRQLILVQKFGKPPGLHEYTVMFYQFLWCSRLFTELWKLRNTSIHSSWSPQSVLNAVAFHDYGNKTYNSIHVEYSRTIFVKFILWTSWTIGTSPCTVTHSYSQQVTPITMLKYCCSVGRLLPQQHDVACEPLAYTSLGYSWLCIQDEI